jgi:predicted transcriptional regulator
MTEIEDTIYNHIFENSGFDLTISDLEQTFGLETTAVTNILNRLIRKGKIVNDNGIFRPEKTETGKPVPEKKEKKKNKRRVEIDLEKVKELLPTHSVPEIAKKLGLDKKNLYYRIKKAGLTNPRKNKKQKQTYKEAMEKVQGSKGEVDVIVSGENIKFEAKLPVEYAGALISWVLNPEEEE